MCPIDSIDTECHLPREGEYILILWTLLKPGDGMFRRTCLVVQDSLVFQHLVDADISTDPDDARVERRVKIYLSLAALYTAFSVCCINHNIVLFI